MVELAGRKGNDRVSTVIIVVAPVMDVTCETEHVLAETVVHDRIQLVAEQKTAGIRPDFTHQGTLGVVALGITAEVAPPVVADLIRHVEAPAGRAGIVPGLDHILRAVAIDEVTHRGAVIGEHRQAVEAEPAFVIAGAAGDIVVEEDEPAAIRGRQRLAGAIGGIALVAVEVQAV